MYSALTHGNDRKGDSLFSSLPCSWRCSHEEGDLSSCPAVGGQEPDRLTAHGPPPLICLGH